MGGRSCRIAPPQALIQMGCPGCVSCGIPQAAAIRRSFAESAVDVLGLHSVFEHHDVMEKATLEAFVHECRPTFPIAIGRPGCGAQPVRRPLAVRARGERHRTMLDPATRGM